MAKPGKALKQSAKSIERYSRKTAKRIDDAQTAIDGNSYDANQFAKDVAGQTFDAWGAIFDLLGAARETPPGAFFDVVVTGGGGNAGPVSATVNLQDTFQNLNQFTKTPLNSGNNTIAVGAIALSNANQTPNAPIDDLKIDVTIPNNQAVGLYQGFISTGSTVQVVLNVNVHT
jgi:hypothetical protein